ncbi:MAG TPA: transposase [Candidatus Sulfotelmatobacter sp.]|nr:transposase [Candidatus Sulfotelmatobacter sp.]
MKLLDSLVARNTFERELERIRRWYGCFVTGYVVMPEHVHLLISEPERGKLSLVIQMLKQVTSRKLKPAAHPAENVESTRPEQAKRVEGVRHPERFWQVRYYDFPVWTEAKRIEKLRYIHRNPVSRGLAERPEDWKWSSFAHYATGVEGAVEIESQWTARQRERLGVVSAVSKAHPPAQTAGRVGQPPLGK